MLRGPDGKDIQIGGSDLSEIGHCRRATAAMFAELSAHICFRDARILGSAGCNRRRRIGFEEELY